MLIRMSDIIPSGSQMTPALVIAIALFVFLPGMVGALVGGMLSQQRSWSAFLIGGLTAAILGLAVLSTIVR